GLGNGEVGPGDAKVGAAELIAQHAPASQGKSPHVVLQWLADVMRQYAGHALARMVDRGSDEVGRPFAGNLNYELAEVGFDDVHPRSFQGRVEMHLLRGHRLRLYG